MNKERLQNVLCYLVSRAIVIGIVICIVYSFYSYADNSQLADWDDIHIAIIRNEPTEPANEQQSDVHVWFPYIDYLPLTYDEQQVIYSLWTEAGFDYATCLGIIDKETGGTFNTKAINWNSGDYGLFQLNKRSWFKTFKRLFGISDMYDMLDIELNTKGALYVYGDCVSRYGETEKALVAYNTGKGNYSSTNYSRDVMSRIVKWREVLNELEGV